MKFKIAPAQTILAQTILALVLLTQTPLAASAETEAERRACTGDAFQFCSRYIPSRDRVAACLARNIDRISYACRAVMESYGPPGNDRGTNAYRYYQR